MLSDSIDAYSAAKAVAADADDLLATLLATHDHLGTVLHRLARRIEFLTEEIDTALARLDALTKDIAPALAAAKGTDAKNGDNRGVTLRAQVTQSLLRTR